MQGRPAILAVVLLLTSCGSDPAEPEASTVAGVWAWVESTGGIQGHTLTPDSEGYEVTLVLADDGTALALRGGELIDEAEYMIQERSSLSEPGSPVEYELTFEPALQLFEFAHAETFVLRMPSALSLELQSPCCDMYDHRFTLLPLEF